MFFCENFELDQVNGKNADLIAAIISFIKTDTIKNCWKNAKQKFRNANIFKNKFSQ